MSQRPFEMVYIDLVNFAKIKSGMGLKRLFIDFTELPNTITLFLMPMEMYHHLNRW